MPEVEIDGKTLKLSNLEKVLYPEAGFTKAEVIDYYVRIADVMLPHLKGRPLTMKRYPNGVAGKHFFEKTCPSHKPEWVKTAPVGGSDGREPTEHCIVADKPTLVWAANLASLEVHTSLALAKSYDRPTMMVFDLDPGAPADLNDCVRVGLSLRDLLDDLGLACFAKSSGGKGLHIYVPLNTRVTYDETKPFAKTIAEMMVNRDPKRIVANMRKDLRKGKVFVDWSQNSEHKTTACVYTLRARQRPTVSTPVTWGEIEKAAKSGKADKLIFEAGEVLKRVEKLGDLFEPMLSMKQKLPRASAKAG